MAPPTTFLDTFTETSTTVYLVNHTADSGFTWAVAGGQFDWVISGTADWVYGNAVQFNPALFTLDSTAFTATFTADQFAPLSRLIFRAFDPYNYLYVRHDGATGTVTLGRRTGDASAAQDEVLDTWTIPDRGGFSATVVITCSGDSITVDINGTVHQTTTSANQAGLMLGMDVESSSQSLRLTALQVDTVTPPPPPPAAAWDAAAFDGGSLITSYAVHMRTLAGDELTAEQTDLSEPLSLNLPAEMLAVSGWIWVTANNAVGAGQASVETLRMGPVSFHGMTQAEYDAATDPASGKPLAQQFVATADFLLSSVKIKGDGTASTVEIHDPFPAGSQTGLPGPLLASVTGDTEELTLATPLYIRTGQRFVVQMDRTAAFLLTAATLAPDAAVTLDGRRWTWSAVNGYYQHDNTWYVAMQLGLA